MLTETQSLRSRVDTVGRRASLTSATSGSATSKWGLTIAPSVVRPKLGHTTRPRAALTTTLARGGIDPDLLLAARLTLMMKAGSYLGGRLTLFTAPSTASRLAIDMDRDTLTGLALLIY